MEFYESPILFTPIQVGNLKLVNRIVIAPMQQYSAEDGQMNDWHLKCLSVNWQVRVPRR